MISITYVPPADFREGKRGFREGFLPFREKKSLINANSLIKSDASYGGSPPKQAQDMGYNGLKKLKVFGITKFYPGMVSGKKGKNAATRGFFALFLSDDNIFSPGWGER